MLYAGLRPAPHSGCFLEKSTPRLRKTQIGQEKQAVQNLRKCQRRTPPLYPPQALHEKPQRYGNAKVSAVPSPRNPAHPNRLQMLLRRLKVDIAHRSDSRSIWSVARTRRTTLRRATPRHATPHRAATRPSCTRNSTGSTASVKYMPPRRSLTHPNQLPVAAPPLEN